MFSLKVNTAEFQHTLFCLPCVEITPLEVVIGTGEREENPVVPSEDK